MCSALIVNRERGGDLPIILERIASASRELFRLEEKIRTETSGPRFEGRVMMAVPPLVLFMLFLAEPELINTMFTSPIGIAIITLATVLMTVAFVWMQKILNTEA